MTTKKQERSEAIRATINKSLGLDLQPLEKEIGFEGELPTKYIMQLRMKIDLGYHDNEGFRKYSQTIIEASPTTNVRDIIYTKTKDKITFFDRTLVTLENRGDTTYATVKID